MRKISIDTFIDTSKVKLDNIPNIFTNAMNRSMKHGNVVVSPRKMTVSTEMLERCMRSLLVVGLQGLDLIEIKKTEEPYKGASL